MIAHQPSTAIAAKTSDKQLLDATRPFATERPRLSSWHVVSTFVALAAAIAAADLAPGSALRLGASILSGLLIVRGFVLYHDVLHGSLMRRSALARSVFYVYGVLVLTPPRVWRETHNYHHAHTAQLVGSHVGSFPTVSIPMWRRMNRWQRLRYRAARHPLAIVCAYLTVFLYGMCLTPFLRNPRKNWDSALAFLVHGALTSIVLAFGGPRTYVFCLLLPFTIAHALGAYLFYAQHNFASVHIESRESWSYTRAALTSSSYMPMGPMMRWFTANIGYHHVHHLNPSIPFYRLPEAMAALPALQHPGVTTLGWRDILDCIGLKVWDPQRGRMVGLPREESG
jgi:omega-6 fatty acid desaturase (delta-12 desaturase)